MRLRAKRITKSQAAREVGISRRTVIRYAKQELISEDRRGRVFLREVEAVWQSNYYREYVGPRTGARLAAGFPEAYRRRRQAAGKYLGKSVRAVIIGTRAKHRRKAPASAEAVVEWVNRKIEAEKRTVPGANTHKLALSFRPLILKAYDAGSRRKSQAGGKIRKKALPSASVAMPR